MNISRFFPYKCIRIKFDLAIKKVKVKLDLSFVQTWYRPQPQCYIPSPKAIGLLVPENKVLKGFLPYMGVVALTFETSL